MAIIIAIDNYNRTQGLNVNYCINHKVPIFYE